MGVGEGGMMLGMRLPGTRATDGRGRTDGIGSPPASWVVGSHLRAAFAHRAPGQEIATYLYFSRELTLAIPLTPDSGRVSKRASGRENERAAEIVAYFCLGGKLQLAKDESVELSLTTAENRSCQISRQTRSKRWKKENNSYSRDTNQTPGLLHDRASFGRRCVAAGKSTDRGKYKQS